MTVRGRDDIMHEERADPMASPMSPLQSLEHAATKRPRWLRAAPTKRPHLFQWWADCVIEDPVCLLRWARPASFPPSHAPETPRETQLDNAKRVRAIMLPSNTEPHPALIASLAIIKLAVTECFEQEQDQENVDEFRRQTVRLLVQFATTRTLAVTDEKTQDLLKWLEQIMSRSIFETFAQPVVGMFGKDRGFPEELIWWLMDKGKELKFPEDDRLQQRETDDQEQGFSNKRQSIRYCRGLPKEPDTVPYVTSVFGNATKVVTRQAEAKGSELSSDSDFSHFENIATDVVGYSDLQCSCSQCRPESTPARSSDVPQRILKQQSHAQWPKWPSLQNMLPELRRLPESKAQTQEEALASRDAGLAAAASLSEEFQKELWAKSDPPDDVGPPFDLQKLRQNPALLQDGCLRTGCDMPLCTHLILFERGGFVDDGVGVNKDKLFAEIAKDSDTHTMMVMVNGGLAEFKHDIMPGTGGRNMDMVLPLLGTGGLSHYVARLDEFAADERTAKDRTQFSHAILGKLPQDLSENVRSLCSSDRRAQFLENVEKLDLTCLPQRADIEDIVNEVLWGRRQNFDEHKKLLGAAWIWVRKYHKAYRSKEVEGMVTFFVTMLLSISIVIVTVFDGSNECDESPRSSQLHVWLVILPAIGSFVAALQNSRQATNDSKRLYHGCGLMQSEIYKFRTKSGRYDENRHGADSSNLERSNRAVQAFRDRQVEIHEYVYPGHGHRAKCYDACLHSKHYDERPAIREDEQADYEKAIEYAQNVGLLYTAELEPIPQDAGIVPVSRRCVTCGIAKLRHFSSRPRLSWDVSMIFLAMLCFALDLWEGIDEDVAEVNDVSLANTMFWLTLPVFAVDMVLNLFTTGLCPNNQMIGDPQDWWDNMSVYLTGWFWIDIVALVPWGRIVNGGNSRERGTRILRVLRIVRMLKLLRASKHIQRVKFNIKTRNKLTRGGDNGVSFLRGLECLLCTKFVYNYFSLLFYALILYGAGMRSLD